MKKRFLLVALLLACICIFAGCDKKGKSDDSGKTPQDSTSVSYTVRLHKSDDGQFTTLTTDGEYLSLSSASGLRRNGYSLKGIYDSASGGSLYYRADGTQVQMITQDIDLYCRWEAQEQTVNFLTQIGRVDTSSVTVRTGEAIPFVKPLYNETQYTFVGWYYADEQVSDADGWKAGYETMSESYFEIGYVFNLTAKYEVAKLTVTFDYNDGSYETKTYTIPYGEMFDLEFPQLTGINKEVAYWSEDRNGSTVYSADYIQGNLTLYAIWRDFKTVKFYTDDETFTELKFYKDEDIEVEDPIRDGYEFDGWYASQNYSGNPVESFSYGLLNKIYYAKWTALQYTLVLTHNGETILTRDYVVTDAFELPQMPAVTGYTFDGWGDDDGNVYKRKVAGHTIGTNLHAVYSPECYYIYYLDGTKKVGELLVYYDKEFKLEAPFKRGYEFVEFTLDGVPFVSGIYDKTEDITLNVTYEPINYNIIYYLDGGTNAEENPATYTVLDEIVLAQPTKKNYTFEGWYADANFSTLVETILSDNIYDRTLYAKFKGENKAALLNANGGSCQKESIIIQYGTTYKLPVCTKVDYSFDGWFTSAEDDAVRLTDAEGNSLGVCDFDGLNTTVYAKYIPRYYVTLKLSHPGAAEIAVGEFYLAGETVTLDFTYDNGYTFAGYFDENDLPVCYSTKYSFRMPAKDVVLQVKFEPSYFTLTFDLPEGVYCMHDSVEVEYGANYTLPIAYIDGKTFVAWQCGYQVLTDENGQSLTAYNEKAGKTLTPVFADAENGAVLIRTAEEFLSITKDGNYVLLANINLAGKNWTAIDFTGHLEGLEHKITGLTGPLFLNCSGTVTNLTVSGDISAENTEATETTTALFAIQISGGLVDGVNVEGKIDVTGKYCVGSLCYKLSGGTVTNCSSKATVICSDNGDAYEVGGLVAYMTGGKLQNCTFRGNVTGGSRVGGLVGQLTGGSYRELTNYGAVTGTNYVGGVIGYITYSGTIGLENLYLTNEGRVTGTNYVGGVIGCLSDTISSYYNNYSVKLSYLYNKNTVMGTSQVGGIIGRLYLNNSDRYSVAGYLTNLYNTANITGDDYVGGLFGYFYSDTSESYLKYSSSKNCTVTAKAMVGGLAGRIENPYISDCSNEGMTITATEYILDGTDHNAFLGGYAGRSCTVKNCTNDANLVYESDGRYVGGIAGYSNGTASGCTNNGNVTAVQSDYVGGIFGYLDCGGTYTADNCTNTGDIKGVNYVAGLFGQFHNYVSDYYSGYTLTIKNMTNTGDITATGDYVGGIFGKLYGNNGNRYSVNVNVSDANNTGNIVGATYVGGIAGYIYSDTSESYLMSSSSKNCTVTAKAMVGGLAGRIENPYISDCSNEGMTITATEYILDGTDHNAFLGGYAGRSCTVKNCTNDANLVYESDGRYVGGIAGYSNGTASGCTNNGNVTAVQSDYVGGIFGYLDCGGTYTADNCTNTGDIKGVNYVAGLFGQFHNYVSDYYSGYTLTIKNMTNTGDITATGRYVGGICGCLYANNSDRYSVTVSVTQTVNTGNITGSDNIAGIFGYTTSDGGITLTECSSSDCTVTGKYYVGGLLGNGNNASMTSCKNDNCTVTATGFKLDGSNMYAYVGGLAGYCVSMTSCTNNSALIYTSYGQYVGGLAGYTVGGLTDCTNEGDVTAIKSVYVGGISGYAKFSGKLSGCQNSGNVTGSNYTGGICGRAEGATPVENSSNTGAIVGVNYVGGLCGYYKISSSVTVNTVTNSGAVTGEDYIGGLFGEFYASSASAMNLSENTGTVTATTENTGAIAGKQTNLTVNELS